MRNIKYNNWTISENAHSDFYACNGIESIHFISEYRNGLYFNIKNYFNGKRNYNAQRYLYKIIPIVGEMAFELLKNNKLWDYENQCPALETYKKDILPYYNKCKELGMDPGEWLDNLFNN